VDGRSSRGIQGAGFSGAADREFASAGGAIRRHLRLPEQHWEPATADRVANTPWYHTAVLLFWYHNPVLHM